jgi:DNA-binding LytR/AlgR family response regulator
MTQQAGDDPDGWANRRLRRDNGRTGVTSGRPTGTSGAQPPARAWLAVAGLLLLVIFVNVTTQLDDAHRRGVELPISLTLTLEISSAIAALIAAVIIGAAVRLAPPGRAPLWRTIVVHLAGSLAYSGAHVALMTLLRTLAFSTVGHAYRWTVRELPYEYRKDVLAYVVVAGLFWMLTRQGAGPTPPASGREASSRQEPIPAGPAAFDIRDGAAILRVPVGEVLAARAAGNYVEFALEDGRRPLMRASLAQIEAALAPHGFVRAHRSWLINPDRVRALSAAGSGDFRVDLGCGLTAPVSRRYPAALARLRGEAPERVPISRRGSA